jgi:crotonobetainyl-CoA:carnitine CoA-transferase CaiB-like acyl-CoA transferase
MSDAAAGEAPGELPLSGIRVLDFGHTVMGPTCGVVLADLGAEVIRVEPPEGDRTRRMYGFARGFFGAFNRNKRSLGIDLKHPEGRAIIERLLPTADVLIENFAPGAMDRLGLGWEQARAVNPRLIYCALKGYLPGPYEHLPALDEVVQMQGGLTYMTGPPGRPLRAGTSVVDIMGGVFGAVAILAALRDRDRTGQGRLVRSALFESVAFMVGQHMASIALTGQECRPCRRARRPGRSTTCSTPRTARSSSPSPATRTGSGSASNSASPTCSPIRRSPPTTSGSRRASG